MPPKTRMLPKTFDMWRIVINAIYLKTFACWQQTQATRKAVLQSTPWAVLQSTPWAKRALVALVPLT